MRFDEKLSPMYSRSSKKSSASPSKPPSLKVQFGFFLLLFTSNATIAVIIFPSKSVLLFDELTLLETA